ncbi:hypothetical protein [Mycolicibacterium sp.]|uniref:hypothetical protein n=1 Tax=Mycolicibacterium sp. TaxID=2320850 RepID=UPI003D0C39BB
MPGRHTAYLLAAAVALAGCGGNGEGPQQDPPAIDPAQMTDAQAAPQRLVLDVTVEGSAVTPVNAQLSAVVGQPIVIRVDSDRADELHVHSSPEHSFPVEARPGQSFQFTVDVPGRVDVELHEIPVTVATIQVQ